LTCYYVLLKSAINTGKKEPEILMIEKFLVKYKGKININLYNHLYYSLSMYFFVTGDYRDAVRIINILFSSKLIRLTPYLEPYSRLLNILIHFELHNRQLLNYLIASTLKYLKNKNKLFEVEYTVLKFLRKINGMNNNEDIHEKFLSFKKKLVGLKKDKYEKNAFEYLDFIRWADSKMSIE
jgi:hypothetical protein